MGTSASHAPPETEGDEEGLPSGDATLETLLAALHKDVDEIEPVEPPLTVYSEFNALVEEPEYPPVVKKAIPNEAAAERLFRKLALPPSIAVQLALLRAASRTAVFRRQRRREKRLAASAAANAASLAADSAMRALTRFADNLAAAASVERPDEAGGEDSDGGPASRPQGGSPSQISAASGTGQDGPGESEGPARQGGASVEGDPVREDQVSDEEASPEGVLPRTDSSADDAAPVGEESSPRGDASASEGGSAPSDKSAPVREEKSPRSDASSGGRENAPPEKTAPAHEDSSPRGDVSADGVVPAAKAAVATAEGVDGAAAATTKESSSDNMSTPRNGSEGAGSVPASDEDRTKEAQAGSRTASPQSEDTPLSDDSMPTFEADLATSRSSTDTSSEDSFALPPPPPLPLEDSRKPGQNAAHGPSEGILSDTEASSGTSSSSSEDDPLPPPPPPPPVMNMFPSFAPPDIEARARRAQEQAAITRKTEQRGRNAIIARRRRRVSFSDELMGPAGHGTSRPSPIKAAPLSTTSGVAQGNIASSPVSASSSSSPSSTSDENTGSKEKERPNSRKGTGPAKPTRNRTRRRAPAHLRALAAKTVEEATKGFQRSNLNFGMDGSDAASHRVSELENALRSGGQRRGRHPLARIHSSTIRQWAALSEAGNRRRLWAARRAVGNQLYRELGKLTTLFFSTVKRDTAVEHLVGVERRSRRLQTAAVMRLLEVQAAPPVQPGEHGASYVASLLARRPNRALSVAAGVLETADEGASLVTPQIAALIAYYLCSVGQPQCFRKIRYIDITDQRVGPNGAEAIAAASFALPNLEAINFRNVQGGSAVARGLYWAVSRWPARMTDVGGHGRAVPHDSAREFKGRERGPETQDTNLEPVSPRSSSKSSRSGRSSESESSDSGKSTGGGDDVLSSDPGSEPLEFAKQRQYDANTPARPPGDVGREPRWDGSTPRPSSQIGIQRMCPLRDIDLTGSKLGPRGAKWLGQAMMCTPHLESLTIYGCSVGDLGIMFVAAGCLAAKSLVHLDVGANHISARGVSALGQFVGSAKCPLEALQLWDNPFADDGCAALSDCLQAGSALRVLGLWDVSVKRGDGVETLLEHIRVIRMPLEVIDLRDNVGVGPRVARRVAALLVTPRPTLRSVLLDGTQIGDDGLTAIAKAAAASTTIQLLDASNCGAGMPGVNAVADALRTNSSLLQLTLAGPQVSASAIAGLALAIREKNRTLSNIRVHPPLDDPEVVARLRLPAYLADSGTERVLSYLHKTKMQLTVREPYKDPAVEAYVREREQQALKMAAEAAETDIDKILGRGVVDDRRESPRTPRRVNDLFDPTEQMLNEMERRDALYDSNLSRKESREQAKKTALPSGLTLQDVAELGELGLKVGDLRTLR